MFFFVAFLSILALSDRVKGFVEKEFQRYDGWYNNPYHAGHGSVESTLVHRAIPSYSDHIGMMGGKERPDAGWISLEIMKRDQGVKHMRDRSALFAYFGQLVTGEIVSTTASGQIACPIEKYDMKIYSQSCQVVNKSSDCQVKHKTMSLYRAAIDEETGYYINVPRKQINFVSSWIDGGFIYGTMEPWVNSLRSFRHGKLKMPSDEFPDSNSDSSPPLDPSTTGQHSLSGGRESLFTVGNLKSNQNPPLLALTVVWHKWHNFQAERLTAKYPNLSDEDLFQEARRWVVATLQNVIIYEYLPLLLDKSVPVYKGYRPEIDPSVTVEFQAAAFRFGHSLIPPGMLTRSDDCSFHITPMCKHWWKSQDMIKNFTIESVIRGLVSQPSEALDHHLADLLTEELFGSLSVEYRDLAALNLMRGREMGLADYNTVRASYGLEKIREWKDINKGLYEKDRRLFAKLNTIYNRSLDHLDLYLFGLLESTNDQLGPTFHSIIEDQFLRIRDGDRFWFENRENKLFTAEEIQEIKGTRLYDILIHSIEVNPSKIQQNVFRYEEAICKPHRLLLERDFSSECDDPKQQDRFSGSEWSFIFTFVALGLIPIICVLVGVIIAKHKEKQTEKLRRRHFSRRGTMRIRDSFLASEKTGISTERRIQVQFSQNNFGIQISSREGKSVRLISLRSIDVVRIQLSSQLSKDCLLIVHVPKEYDLVLTFGQPAERAELWHNLECFIRNLGKEQVTEYGDSHRLLAECVTYDHRQKMLKRFFQTAFDQVFHAKQKQSAEPQSHKFLTPLRGIPHFPDSARRMPHAKESKDLLTIELNKQELASALQLKPDSVFVEQMFELADTDSNGYISYFEFIDLLALMSKGDLESKMRMLFLMYDVDGSEDLDAEEFRIMVKSLLDLANQSLNPDELDNVIQNMLQQSGIEHKERLTFEDFMIIIQHHQPNLLNAFSYRHQSIRQGKSGSRATPAATTPKSAKSFVSMRTLDEETSAQTPEQSGPVKRWLCSLMYKLENFRSHIIMMILFFAVVIFLFVNMAITYAIFKEHRGFRKVVGTFAAISRGAAAGLAFSMAVMMVSVCRNLLTMLRDTVFGNYIPIDSAITLHRISAWTTVVLSVVHIVGHALNFYQLSTQPVQVIRCLLPEHYMGSDETPKFHHWAFITVPGITGVLLVVAFSILSVFATQKARHKIFQAFWATHRLFPVIIALVIIHGSAGLLQRPFFYSWIVGPVVLYIIDWIISMRRRGIILRIHNAETLPSDVTHLSFRLPTCFRYQSGQWLRLACVDLSKREFHPFTICSAPHEKTLDVYIRGVGPWTKRLNNIFSERLSMDNATLPKMIVDGPYGSTHQDWDKFEVVILMGAGIGVTPTASVMKDLVHKVYQQKETIACKKIYFIWMARNHTQFEWFMEILRDIEEEDYKQYVSMDIFITQLIKDYDLRTMMLYICDTHFQRISHKSLFTGLRAKTHFGRIDFNLYLSGVKQAHPEVSKIGVFSCGPKSAVHSIKGACKKINESGSSPILIPHEEIF